MDFRIKFETDMNSFIYALWKRIRHNLRSEASNPQQLEILTAASSRKLIGLENEELLVHSDRFVDSWIEEIFSWILAAFVHG